ncbi:NAD(P)/FAD-dependent oxidoreductase [Microbacterium sp.]|uniref:NAD(P)/FAD-dependent oxidoreductase n=1 Tax=Microbacterium sp. TaxID=51671 RepID=UPI003A84209D
MTTPRDAGRVVIVGAGLAGYSAALQLRTLGHDGPIALVDSESTAYDRPPLSKRLFGDDFTIDALAFATHEALAEKDITTHFGSAAVALDPAAPSVSLRGGSHLEADTVLLTVGGRARSLPIPGIDLPGVHMLRTFEDAVAIRERVSPGVRAVVIGAGLIGAELTSSLRIAGADVTLVDPVQVPLIPAIGEALATRLHDMHTERGVEVIVGVTAEISQSAEHLQVEVDAGPTLPADLVIVGVGLVPNVELAAAAGLDIDNGVLVDESARTSAPGVFAAGDVARLRDSSGTLHRREEHWEAAETSGKHAAYGMLGLDAPARGAPWFWSDRHDVHLEAVGRLSGSGKIVVREGGAYPAVFLVEDGLLVGAAAVDDTNLVRAARRLIDNRVPVTATELADPSVSLRAVLRVSR